MGDVMLFGVLRMPPDMWRDDPIDKAQRHSRYLQAADEIERLRVEIERLRGLIRELAGAQDTMALLVARGPEWSGYQQAMDKAALRRAQAIIALCEEVRAGPMKESCPEPRT